MDGWQNPKINFLAPYSSVGLVVSNGKLANEMIHAALSNPTPYYPLADSTYRDQLGVVKRGEIAFQTLDLRMATYSSSCSSDPFVIERENATMKSITIANGQGDAALSNYDLMNSVQFTGIIEMNNTCSDRFNILSDGIVDVRNNGTKTITVGDTVIAYFPTREEMMQGADKHKHKDELARVVKAWFMPYEPGLHAMTVKGIFDCLQDTRNAKNRLPGYRKMCTQFMDSAIGMAMVMIARILPDLRRVMAVAGTTDAELLTFLLAILGHSEFKDQPGVNATRRVEVRDALFLPFSATSRDATEYLYPLNATGITKNERDLRLRLNEVQQKSTALGLESIIEFNRYIENLIIGRAKSTARPGYDFSLKIDK